MIHRMTKSRAFLLLDGLRKFQQFSYYFQGLMCCWRVCVVNICETKDKTNVSICCKYLRHEKKDIYEISNLSFYYSDEQPQKCW